MLKQSLALLILFLLSSVTFVSAVPQDDLPETSYNESDTPVNQTAPVVPGVRFARPEAADIVVSTRVGDAILRFERQLLRRKRACPLIRRDSRPLRDLLCTFLI
jgi:hypothetical protein